MLISGVQVAMMLLHAMMLIHRVDVDPSIRSLFTYRRRDHLGNATCLRSCVDTLNGSEAEIKSRGPAHSERPWGRESLWRGGRELPTELAALDMCARVYTVHRPANLLHSHGRIHHSDDDVATAYIRLSVSAPGAPQEAISASAAKGGVGTSSKAARLEKTSRYLPCWHLREVTSQRSPPSFLPPFLFC
eukprot:GHVU01076944.1.p1 GENE.GHVU01076944.1~~GHVU01076944.1.p1  ORF type:complete len:189 (+),score=6.40 GHVU01076944.1:49-615(+)